MRVASVLLVVWTAACRDAAHAPEHLDAAAPLPAESVLVWRSSSVALEPDGRTQPWSLELPGGMRAFAVRSSMLDQASSRAACFQLEDVIVQGDQRWVSEATTADYGDYCTTCRERVAVGAGYGFHVLPSGADDGLVLSAVRLRVALRDCITLTPLTAAESGADQLRVEHAAWVPPPPGRTLQLPLSIVVASAHGFVADDGLLANAIAQVREIWSSASIEIVVAAERAIDPSAVPIAYTARDRAQLAELTRAARAALDADHVSRLWPLVVLTNCLQRTDVLSGERTEPLALTPHTPGGFGLFSEPDAMFVAAERCEGLVSGPRFLDAATLGAVMAHELGHYLGLFHVVEADGRSDNLSDTTPEQSNLMRVSPSAASLTLTRSQAAIARRHPVFAMASGVPSIRDAR